jgi:hypothetical protein
VILSGSQIAGYERMTRIALDRLQRQCIAVKMADIPVTKNYYVLDAYPSAVSNENLSTTYVDVVRKAGKYKIG